MIRVFHTAVLILIASVATVEVASSGEPRIEDASRIVAISDVHGAYDAMVTTLQNAAILGGDLEWVGGDATLVIVGDILDRGPKSRAAMELLMRLEGEAEAAGGRVEVLIGNHEAMIMTGDMRYVSRAEYAAFAADEDPALRELWFERYTAQQGAEPEALRADFDKAYPPGFFAMKRAFRKDGRYGQWLLEKNILAVINDTAFVHGGLSPDIARLGLEGINAKSRNHLAEYVDMIAVLTDAGILLPTDSHYRYESRLQNYIPSLDEDLAVLAAIQTGIRLSSSRVLGVDGPLWYRSNVRCPGIIEETRVMEALAAIDAERIVVGHTPTPNRQILQRFDGRLIEIDTGMLNFYYRGIGNALVIEGDIVSVANQKGETSLAPLEHPRKVGHRPGNLSTEDLAALLATGEIVSVQNSSPSVSRIAPRTEVVITDGENRINAIFDKRKGKHFYPGVAAYRLDRLLNLDMVPVTVKREVDGSDGSLQFLPDNVSDEVERSQTGLGGSASCPIMEQWAAMYVFDVLAYNEGRSQQRMLYDKSTWSLILSEHDRVFPNKTGRPKHLENASLTVSNGWRDALLELSEEALQENLGDVIDKRRMRALITRRDELLQQNHVENR